MIDWIKRLINLPAKPANSGKRLYAGARNSRLTFKAPGTSSDTELVASLATLRNRSRALVRDVVYAKRARQVVINNVIGSGVGMQAQVMNQRRRLLDSINDSIESAWTDWSRSNTCHTGGTLHFCDLERAAMGEVFTAGECFIRKHNAAFGGGSIPLALELIEAERIADEFEVPQPLAAGSMMRLGVEVDRFGRPLAYWVREYHPNEMRTKIDARSQRIERVPADQIIHIKLTDRWPQTRGEPWLHAAIGRLNQLGEFEEAAVIAARIGASKVGFFENPEGDVGIADGTEADGTPNMTVEAGEFTQLPPGYKFSSWDPAYPNDAFDPFTRACLRGIAAGVGVSYEALSRDYSQSNYSSSRLALLDDRDLWRSLQQWWVRSFREPLHREWMQAAVLAGAIPRIDVSAYAMDRTRFEAVKFKPRGWSWVDPTKEVNAYKEAEKAGYITKTDIIAATGGGMDIEDVIATRKRELELMQDAGLTSDTTSEPAPATANPAADDDETEDTSAARVFAFQRDYP